MLAVVIILLCFIFVLCYWIYSITCNGVCKFSGHLVGKVIIVTGANSGIGFETSKDLAQRGARVIIACRNLELGAIAKEEIINSSNNKDIHLHHLDLQSFTSIRKFVDIIYRTQKKIDILINNAGIYSTGTRRTEDGLLTGMQINYFGPFLLTSLLLPLLKESPSGRIVNVSSFLYRFARIDFENLNKERNGCLANHEVYCNTKLCNILMTIELDRRLKGTAITANCLHPGVVNTKMMYKVDILLITWILRLLHVFFKTPWEGAQTTIYLAVSPDVKDVSGCYFKDCRLAKLNLQAQNLDTAQKLWEISEELVKLK